jgi:NADPH-dependent curcumin reductase CurA
MTTTNRQILLASRPKGEASAANFRLVETPLPTLADGQVLVRHHFLSLDPYMRGRMDDAKSYAAAQPLDTVMIGGTVGVVAESKHPSFQTGDNVVGMGGWQEYSVVDAAQPGALRKVETSRIPLSAYLGAVGMPGVTAWYGLVKICAPKAGETVVVTAASGAVGSAVGQLAKARGCRAVGIDGHFENVGGTILDAVLARMNAFGRIALCGMISGYDGQPIPLTHPQLILKSRLLVQGFIVSEHMEVWPEALKELGTLVATGKLKYRESVAEGIAAAPEAFLGLLKGRNFGKQLVKLT